MQIVSVLCAASICAGGVVVIACAGVLALQVVLFRPR
jgi:hypothetical protein